jgi:SAC3/GANP family
LDVYQFIWDRTRMVRKDFILQNYVGTGGNCDARAVRCHERIARWHAMCEHQLSHIPEFVTHQSQQNIQELGQTMKTLNQYYDDALGRSRVEVPDEAGNETRTVTRGFSHGCSCDIVQGQDPVDFNQSPLSNNTESIERRLIGNSANHGTAEAEMRGLYMLLTIDNDGGMEGKYMVERLLLVI